MIKTCPLIDMNRDKLLSLVVPCYNETQALPLFIAEVQSVISLLSDVKTEVILVNDGSSDGTLVMMRELRKQYGFVRYLSFSRNFGKESAILAGLSAAKGD